MPRGNKHNVVVEKAGPVILVKTSGLGTVDDFKQSFARYIGAELERLGRGGKGYGI